MGLCRVAAKSKLYRCQEKRSTIALKEEGGAGGANWLLQIWAGWLFVEVKT